MHTAVFFCLQESANLAQQKYNTQASTLSLVKPSLLIAVSLATLTLSGCSARVSNWLELAETAFSSPDDVSLTPAEISDYPYAAQYIRVDGEARALIGLNFDDNGQLKWISGGQEIIVTQAGRIIETVDLKNGPRFTTNLEADPLLCWREKLQQQQTSHTCPATWQREVEFGDVGLQSNHRVEITSTFNAIGEEVVDMPNGTTQHAIKLTETSDNFNNTFWLEVETGRVIKSEQWLSAAIGSAQLQEVKPYSGDLK